MSVPENLRTIRTLEDVSYLLNVLNYNMDSVLKNYYTIFIDPTPQDVELEIYNEQGQLTTIIVPNRAKDNIRSYTGAVPPEGVQIAGVGATYIDTETASIYYKSSGSDAYGWIKIWTVSNLVAGINYLAPDGNGSQLTALNASNIASGTLPVLRGGTGVSNITGLIKGNGTNPYTAAVDGVDFLGPNASTGMIAYYPVNMTREEWLNFGWLPCDGSAISRTTYSRLYNKIGTAYGTGDGSTTFNIPDLMSNGGYFIRCWNGTSSFNTVQNDQVGSHTHPLTGNTGAGSPHGHAGGTLSHTHTLTLTHFRHGKDGAYQYEPNWGGGDVYDGYATGANVATTDGAASWAGLSGTESAHTHTLTGNTAENASNQETRVKNKMLIPIIKF